MLPADRNSLLVISVMGLGYWYFAAEDDAAATTILMEEWPPPPPTFVDEGIRPEELVELELLLTDRSRQEIGSDPRCGAELAVYVAEGEDVAEMGLLTLTDDLVSALASADVASLADVATASGQPVESLSSLASVARHASARGHHLYSIWIM